MRRVFRGGALQRRVGIAWLVLTALVYFAAAVFFASLYETSPIDLDYVPGGISADQARQLREIAWQTVVDYKTRDR